jgi:outer membrane receptor protein involved in Fe transport
MMALLMAVPAFAQQTTPPPAETAAAAPAPTVATEKKEETVVLSPFVVSTSKDTGYYAANTLAGSRMNTNIADLGAAISVVTKQQMEDTGSLDINDVFRYEINTEGSSTYTPTGGGYLTLRSDGVMDVSGGASIGSSVTPFTNATANRVRGIGVPSSATNYYPSIGQVPFDAYNVSSVEISRGPNSMLFGLGSPAGIVNQSTAQAQMNRDTANVTVRFDQYGSYRGSVNFNKGLIDDKLALYGAAVYDNRQFDRQPSYDKTTRYYGALTYKPFKKTTFKANFESYDNENRRPNTLTPRDFITQWNLAGQPYYDPLTRQIKSNVSGKTLGDYVVNAASPLAQEVRDFIKTLPNYNPALRGTSATNFNGTDTNFTFYNGIGIFGDAALTTNTGFNAANGTPSANAMFVPGIAWTNAPRTNLQIADGQFVNWFQTLNAQSYQTTWTVPPAAANPLFPSAAAVWANPSWANIYNRSYTASAGWTGIGNNIIGYKYPGVTDKAIYDWTDININEMNFGHDKNKNYNLEFEQELLSNLYLTAGWFRQDFHSATNYTVAQLNVATLFVDTNKNLPDGTANPYFGKPYVEDSDPDRYVNDQLDDHYRAMLAYTPDFTRKEGWMKWLGHHQILGLVSRDESDLTQLRQRLEYIDSTSPDGKYRYMANQNNDVNGQPTGWNFQTTSFRRAYYLAAPGDPNGVVTRSSGEWNPLTYSGDIKVYDYAANAFKTVNMTTTFNTFDASTARTQRVVDSISGGITSYLWNDRLVATFGVRKDKYKARATTDAAIIDPVTKATISPALTIPQKWSNGLYNTDIILNRWKLWDKLEGTTRTLGGVLRPFQKWNDIEAKADEGSLVWQFIRDFGFSYNESSNFNPPATAQTDAFMNPLPKPTGEGKDYGFQFQLFDRKLFARVTWFEASNENERTNPGTSISRLTGNVDTTLFRNWARTIAMINMGMDPRIAGFGTGLTTAQETAVQTEAAKIWQLPYTYYDGSSIFATRNAQAEGIEVEVNYNPTRNWTMKFTYGKQDTKYSNVLKEFDAWYDVRGPIWEAAKASTYLLPQYQSLATYTAPNGRAVDLTNFWTSYGYRDEAYIGEPNGNNNVQQYYNAVVTPQVLLARDLDGQSAPGQRKNRWSFLTNYNFSDGALKGWGVGGVERWEDKSIIGYYGRASGANGTQLDVSDTSRPIYDDANFYTDLWVSYTRKIFSDKVRMKLQLNVVNAFESGGLQTVSVNYDGSPYAFRIVDPRQFILTAGFDF